MTWGGRNEDSPRFMLNTDMCLLFDLEQTFPCCSRTDLLNNNGDNPCREFNETTCSVYDESSPRKEAAEAVELLATGGGNNIRNPNNQPFYDAFETAWSKATTNGVTNLRQLDITCVIPTSDPTLSSSSNPTRSVTKTPSASPINRTSAPTGNPTPSTVQPTPSSSTNPSPSSTNQSNRPTRRFIAKAAKLAKTTT